MAAAWGVGVRVRHSISSNDCVSVCLEDRNTAQGLCWGGEEDQCKRQWGAMWNQAEYYAMRLDVPLFRLIIWTPENWSNLSNECCVCNTIWISGFLKNTRSLRAEALTSISWQNPAHHIGAEFLLFGWGEHVLTKEIGNYTSGLVLLHSSSTNQIKTYLF